MTGTHVLRILVTSLVAASLACSAVATTAAAHQPAPPTPDLDPGDCAKLTFVATDADEADVDVYIQKNEPTPEEPSSPEDYQQYAEETLRAAIDFLTATRQPPSQSGDVQVELVWPKNDEVGSDGYRIGVLVDLSACDA